MALLAALLILPGAAAGEVYFEGYLGGMQPATSSGPFNNIGTKVADINLGVEGRFSPAFLGGLRLGTWFVKDGFLGFNYPYPEWAKYFGFYLDFCYHRLDMPRQKGAFVNEGVPTSFTFASRGNIATLAFMTVARYGFLPDAVAPFGRLQPYAAVGPAVMFVSQRPSVSDANPPGIPNMDFSNRSIVDVILAVDAGVRWMALKNVSLDVFFRYRYTEEPTFYYSHKGGQFKLTPEYHIFSGQIGAAYHF